VLDRAAPAPAPERLSGNFSLGTLRVGGDTQPTRSLGFVLAFDTETISLEL
jgi:hypothetical protein